MRVLLDESIPRHLKNKLPGHQVVTVTEQGWRSKENGELHAAPACSRSWSEPVNEWPGRLQRRRKRRWTARLDVVRVLSRLDVASRLRLASEGEGTRTRARQTPEKRSTVEETLDDGPRDSRAIPSPSIPGMRGFAGNNGSGGRSRKVAPSRACVRYPRRPLARIPPISAPGPLVNRPPQSRPSSGLVSGGRPRSPP